MPLSPPVSRQLRHTRAIRAEAYERADGLWDIEACLTDQKPRDVALASGVRPNGLPIHELWLRITIDRKLNVVDAESSSDWVPYPGQCEAVNPAYRSLAGLNLLRNFRGEAARLFGGIGGCTHLTELCAVLPTAAIQAFAGDVWNTASSSRGDARPTGNQTGNPAGSPSGDGAVKAVDAVNKDSKDDAPHPTNDQPPFQLGRCHALRFDGEAVRQFYPRWHDHAPRSAERVDAAREPRAGDPGPAVDPRGVSGNQVQSNSQTEGNHA